ncbi:unnamed protein product, partial [marine sediment metagenome]
GSSVHISLMKADRKIKQNFSDISEKAFLDYGSRLYAKDRVRDLQTESYHQLNQYILRQPYNKDSWCNGVFLTQKGHNLLKGVVEIADYYNFDDSDIQTDYYSVNFSLNLNLGKWNKAFIDGE